MDMSNKQLLASLARLDKHPDFVRFVDIYLEGLLDESIQSCIEADIPARYQGAAQILQRIKTDLAEAEEAFYKVTNQAEIPLG